MPTQRQTMLEPTQPDQGETQPALAPAVDAPAAMPPHDFGPGPQGLHHRQCDAQQQPLQSGTGFDKP